MLGIWDIAVNSNRFDRQTMKLTCKARRDSLSDEAQFEEAAQKLADLSREYLLCAPDQKELVFGKIYDHLARPIYCYIKGRFKLEKDYAMTALHDTLLVIARASSNSQFFRFSTNDVWKNDPKAQLRWVFGVARRKAIDVLRKKANYGNMETFEVDGVVGNAGLDIEFNEMKALFEELVSQLPGRQKLVAMTILENLPRKVTRRRIVELLQGNGHDFSENSVKRALEEVRRKFDEFLKGKNGSTWC